KLLATTLCNSYASFSLQFLHYFFPFFFLMIRRPPRSTLFPTRRSSDLLVDILISIGSAGLAIFSIPTVLNKNSQVQNRRDTKDRDRKSTRLNSSHVAISYAVFCLKKKKKRQDR